MATNNLDKTILKKKVAMNPFVLIINDSEVFGKSTQTSFFWQKGGNDRNVGGNETEDASGQVFVPWTCFFGLLFGSMADQDSGEYDADDNMMPMPVPPTTLATTPTAEKFDKENLPPRTDQRTAETRT